MSVARGWDLFQSHPLYYEDLQSDKQICFSKNGLKILLRIQKLRLEINPQHPSSIICTFNEGYIWRDGENQYIMSAGTPTPNLNSDGICYSELGGL